MATIDIVDKDGGVLLRWVDGDLYGPLERILIAQQTEQLLAEELGPPEGPFSTAPHFRTAEGFINVMSKIIEDDDSFVGDLPEPREALAEDGSPLA